MDTKAFGKKARLFVLENENGLKLSVTDFGARIVALEVPTDEGVRNIVLGFDSEEEYQAKDPYIGATIGRVAGRIAKGQFELDGKRVTVATQVADGNCLHGGPKGFESRYFEVVSDVQTRDSASVTFRYVSPDGENGFPGNLTAEVCYQLTRDNQVKITYHGKTDAPTVYNPTNHVYFNLTGDVGASVADHTLEIKSSEFVVVGEDTTATGEIRPVMGTPFDFQTPKKIAEVFTTDYPQNQLVGGLDHPFLLAKKAGVAQVRLQSPDQKVVVEMETTAPAVVIFTANFGENTPVMHSQKMVNHGGITLETQVSPGALEFPGFGDAVIRPEKPFYSETIFKIS